MLRIRYYLFDCELASIAMCLECFHELVESAVVRVLRKLNLGWEPASMQGHEQKAMESSKQNQKSEVVRTSEGRPCCGTANKARPESEADKATLHLLDTAEHCDPIENLGCEL